MVQIFHNNKVLLQVSHKSKVWELKAAVHREIGILEDDFYLTSNGRRLQSNEEDFENVHIHVRLLGGKGGFGSMLRAIGAQIEKTTNREACRDLSGRRLRDINEEKRLKKWIEAQAEREKEAEDRKLKKLERLCEQPKHEFKDENYYKEREALPEKVVDAVEQGLKSGSKRKEAPTKTVPKKKPKLWVDADVDEELSSSDEGNSDDDEEKNTTESEPSCSSVNNGNSNSSFKNEISVNDTANEVDKLNSENPSNENEKSNLSENIKLSTAKSDD